jgi:hypothetical protein
MLYVRVNFVATEVYKRVGKNGEEVLQNRSDRSKRDIVRDIQGLSAL